jgi:hypothetical protein
MATAAFPGAVKTFPTLSDYVNVVRAADIDALNTEVTAIETTIGANPTTGFAASTLGGALAALNSGKANVGHTHANLPSTPVTIGGPISSTYVAINGTSVQAMNGTTQASMSLQALGGDTTIGSPASNTNVVGTLSASGGASFGSTVTVTGNTYLQALSILGGLTVGPNGNIVLNSQYSNTAELFLWNPAGTGVVAGHNSEGIYASGPYTTVFDGDPVLSTKQLTGQLLIYQIPSSSAGGYSQSCLQMTRPEGNNDFNHYEASIGALVYSPYYNGMRSAMFAFNADTATLGWNSQNGGGATGNDTYSGNPWPITASQFITASASKFKTAVIAMDKGLDEVMQLRPVAYRQLAHVHLPQPHAPGDAKRAATRSIGLIAEEVEKVVPEVLAWGADGHPHGLDYAGLVPLLIKAVQELKGKVDDLESRLAG